MPTTEDQLNAVQEKLQQLLKQHHRLKREAEQLKREVAELKKEKQSSQQTISELQQYILILKSAAGELNERDKKAFEKILNQYIKEIDKCIAFLSQ